jgi:hypothetical protein
MDHELGMAIRCEPIKPEFQQWVEVLLANPNRRI